MSEKLPFTASYLKQIFFSHELSSSKLVLLFSAASYLVIVLFFQSYHQLAYEVSEAREGIVVQEIINYDTWLRPLRHGEVVPSKPPLFHWLSAFLSKATSSYNQFILRAPSLLGAFFCLIALIRLFLLTESSKKSMLLAIGILSSTYCFLQLSIDARVDMLFVGLFSLAYFELLGRYLSHRVLTRNASTIIGILLGLCILSKGPLGYLMCVLSIVFVIALHDGFSKMVSFLRPHAFQLLLYPLLLGALWYISTSITGSHDIIQRQLIFENYDRFFGNSSIPSKPWFFYGQHFFTQFIPWGFLVPVLPYFMWKYEPNFRNHPLWKILSSCLISLSTVFIFLTLASGKRRAYLLLIAPHLAISLALSLEIISPHINHYLSLHFNAEAVRKRIHVASRILCYISALFFVVWVFLQLYSHPNFHYVLQGLSCLSLFEMSSLLCLSIFGHVLVAKNLKENNSNTYVNIFASLWIFLIQFFLTIPCTLYLIKGHTHSYAHLAKEITEAFPENTQFAFIKLKKDESFDSFFFYLGRRVLLHSPSKPLKEGLYITRRGWLRQNKEVYHILAAGARLRDSDRNKDLVVFRLAQAIAPSSLLRAPLLQELGQHQYQETGP